MNDFGPIYHGRRGAKLAVDDDLSPENPRSDPPPPSPGRKSLDLLDLGAAALEIPNTTPTSIPQNPRSVRSRRRNPKPILPRPYRVIRRPTGAKITEEADLSPEKPRYVQPPPPFLPALPLPAGDTRDRSDPKLFRRLPRYKHRLRRLPYWMHEGSGAGVVAAGRVVAAPAEDSSGTEPFTAAPVERL